MYKVIDVSDWRDKIDWSKVKADGVVGAIIRFADGNTLDKRFNENMQNAKAVGIHVGSYIFSRAKTKAQAESEATRLYNACKPYAPDMPLYIDLEARGLGKYADTVAPAFLNKIKALGGRGGVYATLNWWNNYLTKTAKNYSASPFWIAQYNDKMTHKKPSLFGMWQYSSKGKVNGIKGNVDMDHCYIAYWGAEKKSYAGEFPTLTLVKSNAEVKADAVRWACWIAGDNRFHYGYGKEAHHNGCFFCGTQRLKKNKGILDYQYTYCCNPFVGAAWAHGGCVPKALSMCQSNTSWAWLPGKGYDGSKLFDNLGHPAKSSLKAGDVMCWSAKDGNSGHVALYIGNGKYVDASGGDDNIRNSKKWNNSISVKTLTDTRYKKFQRVHRYNSSVNTTALIRHGEISKRVEHLQSFLLWYGVDLTADGIFGDATLAAVKSFQKACGLVEDGIVGEKTIEAMKGWKQ